MISYCKNKTKHHATPHALGLIYFSLSFSNMHTLLSLPWLILWRQQLWEMN